MSQIKQQRITPGWHASLSMNFTGTADRTVVRRTHSGPLRIQRPFYPEGDVCHVYVLHPPGGIVSGDKLDVQVRVGSGASAMITTPGAAKFYRSSGHPGMQTQTLTVSGGSLEWFPQESILFDGCDSSLDTTISISDNACFLGWDIQCYGRPAAGEAFSSGSVTNRIRFLQDGEPVLVERSMISERHSVDRRSGMRGNTTQGMFVATVTEPGLLDAVRKLPALSGAFFATCIDRLMVVRYLGCCAFEAKAGFVDIWRLLRPAALGRTACTPRIWAT